MSDTTTTLSAADTAADFHAFFVKFTEALNNNASVTEMQQLCREYEKQREDFQKTQPADIFPVIDDRYELLKYRIWKAEVKQ